jgi:SAM-dependent methyltransferase
MTEDYWDKVALEARLKIRTSGSYDNWLAIYTDARVSSLLVDALRQYQNGNGGSLLDLGCGSGKWVSLFAKRFPKMTMLGIDLSKQMLELAKMQTNKQKNIGLANMNATRLAISDDRFELITTVTVLQHIADDNSWRAAIREIVRVTKPKGHITVCDATISVGSLKVRKLGEYVSCFKDEGARLIHWEGVDPSYLIKAVGLVQYGRSFNTRRVYCFTHFQRFSSKFSMVLAAIASTIDIHMGKTHLGVIAPHKILVFEKEK